MKHIETINDILEIIKFNKKISALTFSESLKQIINKKNKSIKRLMSFGNNVYKYNEEGIRTYKKVPVYNQAGNITGYNTHNYFVEGNKVLTELIQTTKYGLIRFDYNYDINNNLVSVEFQNQVYF